MHLTLPFTCHRSSPSISVVSRGTEVSFHTEDNYPGGRSVAHTYVAVAGGVILDSGGLLIGSIFFSAFARPRVADWLVIIPGAIYKIYTERHCCRQIDIRFDNPYTDESTKGCPSMFAFCNIIFDV